MNFYLKQVIYSFFAAVLILLPWFVSKNNITSFWLFYFIAFSLLLVNLLTSVKKAVPLLIMIIGLFFIVGYLIKAKQVQAADQIRFGNTNTK